MISLPKAGRVQARQPLTLASPRRGEGKQQQQQRGVAVLMVIVVLAGLLAMSAPFVFSMIQHGRSARSELHESHAREGADAAVAHAMSQLHKTLRYDANNTSPEVTMLNDLRITMDFPAANKAFGDLGVDVKNPLGLLWSARVEDEQGKINVNTAPPTLLGNLLGSTTLAEAAARGATELQVEETRMFPADNDPNSINGLVCVGGDLLRYKHVGGGFISLVDALTQNHPKGSLVFDGRARLISDYKFKNGGVVFSPFRSVMEIKAGISTSGASMAPDEFARIERYLTIFSGMNSPYWGHAARPSEQSFSSGLRGFNIEKGEGFTPGGLIRVVQNGKPLKCGRIRAVALKPDGSAFIALEDDIGIGANGTGVGNDIYIQPELKHPLNLNTASPQVIEAAVMGLCLASNTQAVTRQAAIDLAAFLTKPGSVFTSHEDLRKALDKAHGAGLITPDMRDAIFINASEPNSPKLRTSTVPFCYHSFGTYTIEGSGVSNADNGMQLARHTVRQLVSLPTPWPGRFKIQYQAGFQGLIDQGLASRVVTFPVPMGKFKQRRNAPNTQLPAQNHGDVRLDVGECGPHNLAGEWIEHCDTVTDPGYRQDGYDLNKRGKAFVQPAVQQRRSANSVATQPGSVEMWIKPDSAQQMVFYEEGIDEERNRITFSYEAADGLVIRIYDAGLECQDSAAKGFKHLVRKPVEYIYPIRLDAYEWYHIAGSWKTGTVNGQDIRVDAQPNPPANELIKMKPGSKLANDVDLEEVDTIEVEEADKDDFPLTGAIRIGEEIIEYKQRSGNSFKGLLRGTRLSAIATHKEGELVLPFGYSNPLAQDLAIGGGTLAERIEKANQTNTRVSIPVPPNKINFILDTEVKKLPVDDATNFPPSGFIVAGGELLYYGKRTATSFEKLQRAQGSAGVTAPARNIRDGQGVALASIQVDKIDDYDARGIVQIDDEDNDKLVEWIYHADKKSMDDGKHYLVAELHSSGVIRNGIQIGDPPTPKDGNHVGINRFRGMFGIRPNTAHAKKAKVIPVVRMQGPHCGDQNSPYSDDGVSTVSVVTYGQTDGDLRYVKQAYINQYANWHYTGPNNSCPAKFDNWGFDFYVGLNDFVSRRFTAANSRLLKWPSGELPDAVASQRYVCQDRNQGGMVHGIVDELKLNTHQSIGGRIAMTTGGGGATAGDEDILIEEFDAWPENHSGWAANLNWPTTGGLVRIGDELIFYQSASQQRIEYYADVFPPLNNKPPDRNKADRKWRNPCPPPNGAVEAHPNIHNKTVLKLSNVKRGVLGTTAANHAVGVYATVLDGMAVSALRGQFDGRADNFTLLNGAGFPEEGYAWIGDNAYGGEVASWQKGGNGATVFSGCKNFHGRFGTGAGSHPDGTIVRCLPFRYWDREARNYDGTGLAYIQTGYAAPDAIWDSIELTVKGTEHQPEPAQVQPRLLVRFDGTPSWDVDVTNTEGGLYEFRGKRGIIPLQGGGGSSRGVRADQIDIRLYWEFRPGCFMPRSSDWKRTFAVEKLRATYSSPLIMRRLDEIEKR